eukprot:gene20863-27700_t
MTHVACKNGVLLCDVATEVTGQRLRRDVNITPRDLAAARENILAALDHMGLLPDIDPEHEPVLLQMGQT